MKLNCKERAGYRQQAARARLLTPHSFRRAMDSDSQTRLDLWLWAARFFKTRALAAGAVEGGKVELNGEKPKRAKTVRPGDRLRIRLGPYEHHVTVRAVARRRGSPAVAAELFLEDPAGKLAREHLAEQHRLAGRMRGERPTGRPTKKARRDLERWGDL